MCMDFLALPVGSLIMYVHVCALSKIRTSYSIRCTGSLISGFRGQRFYRGMRLRPHLKVGHTAFKQGNEQHILLQWHFSVLLLHRGGYILKLVFTIHQMVLRFVVYNERNSGRLESFMARMVMESKFRFSGKVISLPCKDRRRGISG